MASSDTHIPQDFNQVQQKTSGMANPFLQFPDTPLWKGRNIALPEKTLTRCYIQIPSPNLSRKEERP